MVDKSLKSNNFPFWHASCGNIDPTSSQEAGKHSEKRKYKMIHRSNTSTAVSSTHAGSNLQSGIGINLFDGLIINPTAISARINQYQVPLLSFSLSMSSLIFDTDIGPEA